MTTETLGVISQRAGCSGFTGTRSTFRSACGGGYGFNRLVIGVVARRVVKVLVTVGKRGEIQAVQYKSGKLRPIAVQGQQGVLDIRHLSMIGPDHQEHPVAETLHDGSLRQAK